MNENIGIRELTEEVQEASSFVGRLLDETQKVIVGQKNMIEKCLIGMLCDGHILLEGLPGLAKTLTIKTMSDTINASFKRIQFTPDLLPADITGTQIYSQKTGEFATKKGPIFANVVLADEINRSPAKVQAALLEAMAEHQITIGDETYKLEEPFIVLATQNPIEQEGTYPLPEAQVDRFMLKVPVVYPTKEEEKLVIERMAGMEKPTASPVISPEEILKSRKIVEKIHMEGKLVDYILDIVYATRQPKNYGLEEGLIEFGASPRASIAMSRASRAHAFLRGRAFVTPEDIRVVSYDVLRHRLLLSYEAEAEDINSDDIISKILDLIEVP